VTHISIVNYAEITADRPRQSANTIFGITCKF